MPPRDTSSSTSGPLFTPDDATIIFVLGGPGSGKGTQSEFLVRDYGFTHLSAGDLLRAEQDRPGSEFRDMIKEKLKAGQIIPMEVTVKLLENAIKKTVEENNHKFLIDGFPRKMDQALMFEEKVCKSKFTLFFDCPEDVMEERLLDRGKTSGRSDDNLESIKKRFKVFEETSMPVVDMYEKQGRVVKVMATQSPEKVYEEVKQKFEKEGVLPK